MHRERAAKKNDRLNSKMTQLDKGCSQVRDDEESNFLDAHVDVEKSSLEKEHSLLIPDRSHLHLVAINAFAFAYGLLIGTFGLVTLPTESERLWPAKHAMLLAIFLAICGVSQLSGPVAGYFSDRCVHKTGRRRPFLFWGGATGIPSLFALQWASTNNNLPMYICFFFVAMLALNIMYVAYSGALTDLVNDNQRGVANGLMGAFTVLGAAVGFGCFSRFLDVQSGYTFYICIVAAALTVSFLSFTETPLDPSSIRPWTWREIWKCYYVSPTDHRDFYLVFVSRTLYYMGISVQTFMFFFFRDVIRSTEPQADVSYLALCGQLTGAIVCIPMGMLSDRVGRKVLVYLSSIVIVAAYVMFMFCRSLPMALLAGAIYGVGNGTYLSVDYALACDTLPSKEEAARYLGIWGVAAFIGTLLGPMLVGPTLLLFGDKGEVDEHGTPMYDIDGYVAIMSIGCVCMFLGSVVVAPIREGRQTMI